MVLAFIGEGTWCTDAALCLSSTLPRSRYPKSHFEISFLSAEFPTRDGWLRILNTASVLCRPYVLDLRRPFYPDEKDPESLKTISFISLGKILGIFFHRRKISFQRLFKKTFFSEDKCSENFHPFFRHLCPSLRKKIGPKCFCPERFFWNRWLLGKKISHLLFLIGWKIDDGHLCCPNPLPELLSTTSDHNRPLL